MAQTLSSRDLELHLQTQERLRSGEAVALRERAGLSQRQVAALIRGDHTTVGRWERGERRVPRGVLALRYGRLLARLAEREAQADGGSAAE